MADLYKAGRVQAVISMGGSAGTEIGTAGMRALPLGVPKVMVSTLASGQVRHYVGDKDILMLNSVVDIAGDGSIQMNIQEMATAVQFCLPVKVAILNNRFLGMVRQWQEFFYDLSDFHIF